MSTLVRVKQVVECSDSCLYQKDTQIILSYHFELINRNGTSGRRNYRGGVVSSPITGVLFSTWYSSGCFRNNCSQSKSVLLSTQWMSKDGIGWRQYKQKYIYRQNKPKPWIGKCHIPTAQGLEHSQFNRGFVGSSPIRVCNFPLHKISICFKNNYSQSK